VCWGRFIALVAIGFEGATMKLLLLAATILTVICGWVIAVPIQLMVGNLVGSLLAIATSGLPSGAAPMSSMSASPSVSPLMSTSSLSSSPSISTSTSYAAAATVAAATKPIEVLIIEAAIMLLVIGALQTVIACRECECTCHVFIRVLCTLRAHESS
jgi:hypothetical protein